MLQLKKKEKNPLNANKNFAVVASFVKDKFASAKLAFFISVASMIEPFLTEFQSDNPLAPFLYQEFTSFISNIMSRFVKKEVLEKATSVSKVDLRSENLLSSLNVDAGYETKAAISKLKSTLPKDKETDLIKKFMLDCRSVYVTLVSKLQNRSPLSYSLTRYISCLDPNFIASNTSVALKRLDFLLETLSTKNIWIEGSVANYIKTEYNKLCQSAEMLNEMKKYNRHEKRLDHFWVQLIAKSPNNNYKNLFELIKFILPLSHGNAALERGFSVNEDLLIENQSENSIVALRIVYDAIKEVGGVSSVPITKSLIQSVRNSHSKYMEFLKKRKIEDQNLQKEKDEKKQRDKELRELEDEKKKKITRYRLN